VTPEHFVAFRRKNTQKHAGKVFEMFFGAIKPSGRLGDFSKENQ
jgi:hypothetical protein